MINFEQRTITGKSGKVYKIEPESITTGRFAHYEIQSLMLAFSSDFKTFYTKLIDIQKSINNVKVLGDVIKISDDVKELLAGIGNYADTNVPKIIRFCALFCNAEDEDTSTINENIYQNKFEDWIEIPVEGFFFLVTNVIPLFKEVLTLEGLEKIKW